jgi:hypothetical protein
VANVFTLTGENQNLGGLGAFSYILGLYGQIHSDCEFGNGELFA